MPDLYLYSDSNLDKSGCLSAPGLAQATERHKIALQVPLLKPTTNVLSEIGQHGVAGAVIEVYGGIPPLRTLEIAQTILGHGRKVFLHWPEENAVELLDHERLRSYRKLSFVVSGYRLLEPLLRLMPGARPSNEHIRRHLKDCMA